jgi:hypothetical protein
MCKFSQTHVIVDMIFGSNVRVTVCKKNNIRRMIMASRLLKDIMKQANDLSVVLPEFQRDFVWKPSDVIKLMASIMNGYPIGGLLFMENEFKDGSLIYSYRPLSGVEVNVAQDKENVLVLDGQQRLTSCYRAFYAPDLTEDADKYDGRYYFDYNSFVERDGNVSNGDLEDLIVFYDRRRVRRDYCDQASEITKGLFPLDIILKDRDGYGYVSWLSRYNFNYSRGDEAEFTRLASIQSKFVSNYIEKITSYQAHYEEIKKGTNPEVICTVFQTINTTGKKLTVFDLLVARCFPRGIRLKELLHQVCEKYTYLSIFDPTGEDICNLTLPRIIAQMVNSDFSSKRGDVMVLSPDSINDNWNEAAASLDKALDFIYNKTGCVGPRFLPNGDILTTLAMILNRILTPKGVLSGDLSLIEEDLLNRLTAWYWRCVFSTYFNSATETKIIRSTKEWCGAGGWLSDEHALPEPMKLPDEAIEIDPKSIHRTDSAIYKAIHCLLVLNGSSDFKFSETKIIDCSVSDLEDHHIYPKNFLGLNGIKNVEANNICNRTLILKSTNGRILNKSPHVYVADINCVDLSNLDAVFEGHLIDFSLLSSEFSLAVYNDFVSRRSDSILRMIRGSIVI